MMALVGDFWADLAARCGVAVARLEEHLGVARYELVDECAAARLPTAADGMTTGD